MRKTKWFSKCGERLSKGNIGGCGDVCRWLRLVAVAFSSNVVVMSHHGWCVMVITFVVGCVLWRWVWIVKMEVLLLIYDGKVGGLTCGLVRLVVSVMYYASGEWGF